MQWNRHSMLEGQHAFLSPSQNAWLRYDDDKLADRWVTVKAAIRGTQLHDLASQCIRLGVKLPGTRQTLNLYVNDAIGFRMQPEQVLFYSENCFGTADAISYRREKGQWVLRVHDLKTGTTRTTMDQLLVYAALFCLEYGHQPAKMKIILRIYKNDEVEEHVPDLDEIVHVMDRIVYSDRIIDDIKRGVLN